MNNQLIVLRHNNRILSCLMERDQLAQVNISGEKREGLLHNIYIGKVKNIVKNINAAFVEIADGQMCYYSLTENTNTIFVNQKNNNKVVIGDEILVQVEKEGVKTKAPVVTSYLTLVGKYVVLTHGKNTLGISNKIVESEKRNQLMGIIEPYKNDSFGLVIRTNAADADKELIENEVKALTKEYTNLLNYGVHKTCFSLIYESPAEYLCDIRDGYDSIVERIVTDDIEIYEKIKQYLSNYQSKDLDKLVFYQDKMLSLKALYSIESKLEKALQERVWLKSGGYLVIQPTEALVVIDVNSGKAIAGKRNPEETFERINLEAAEEIAKQIRLRNLSGIIIIDFIDIKSKTSKDALLTQLKNLFKKDPVRTVVVDMTPLNLVEVTRKKVRKPLYEQIR